MSLGNLLRSTSPEPQNLIAMGQWLRQQLPIRFARRLEDFWQVPHVVVCNPHINDVLNIYLHNFEAISSATEIRNEDDEAMFCKVLSDCHSQAANIPKLLAEGYREVRYMYPHISLDTFLNDLFVGRIASRILMENYIQMRTPRKGFLGVVKQGMNPLNIVSEAAVEITRLTDSIYGCTPEVEYRGNLDCQLDYIPRHVSYMVRELLKNAIRATVERHHKRVAKGAVMPRVCVEFQQGDIHVIIKISDQGGGMPKRVQKEAWQYGWTTVAADGGAEEAAGRLKKELAGYGFGLPLTRLHAQYFGGDVFMQALPGHGTDMYLLLTHLKQGTPATEMDDLSTLLYESENKRSSLVAP